MGDVSEMPTVVHGSRAYRLPFAGLFRPLTDAEAAELSASVAAIGVGHPVFVYDSPEYGPGCVIDGANRLRLAAAAGVDCPVQKLSVTDATARRMAEDLNIARRHVTPEEARAARQERIERVAAARAEGKSTRQIAAEEGVSQSQVVADLKAAGEHPCSPETSKVIGRDGKAYPATKPTPYPVVDRGSEDPGGEHADEPLPPSPVEEEVFRLDAAAEAMGGEPPSEVEPDLFAQLAGDDDEEPDEDEAPVAPESDKPVPGKRKPAKHHRKGGGRDPDHPHIRLLDKIQALAAQITVAINEEGGERLWENLRAAGLVKVRDLTVNGKHYGHVFTGLRGLRWAVRISKGKAKPSDWVRAEFDKFYRGER